MVHPPCWLGFVCAKQATPAIGSDANFIAALIISTLNFVVRMAQVSRIATLQQHSAAPPAALPYTEQKRCGSLRLEKRATPAKIS